MKKILILALVLIGCGKKKPGAGAPLKSFEKGELRTGVYEATPRRNIQIAGFSGYAMEIRIEIEEKRLRILQTFYSEHSSNHPKSLATILTEGEIRLSADSDRETRDLDFKIQEVKLTPLLRDWTAIFPAGLSGQCDFNVPDADLGKPIPVNGLRCDTLGDFPKREQVFLSAYRQLDQDTVDLTTFAQNSPANLGVDYNLALTPRNSDLLLRFYRVK